MIASDLGQRLTLEVSMIGPVYILFNIFIDDGIWLICNIYPQSYNPFYDILSLTNNFSDDRKTIYHIQFEYIDI